MSSSALGLPSDPLPAANCLLSAHNAQRYTKPKRKQEEEGRGKPMSIELVMPTNHFILCCPLLLLPPIPPCIRVFSNESTLHMRWPKYWSFSFSIRPSNEHPGLISFRMDRLDLLAVQGTLKESSPAQFKNINSFALKLHGSTLTFIYDTGKTIAFTI